MSWSMSSNQRGVFQEHPGPVQMQRELLRLRVRIVQAWTHCFRHFFVLHEQAVSGIETRVWTFTRQVEKLREHLSRWFKLQVKWQIYLSDPGKINHFDQLWANRLSYSGQDVIFGPWFSLTFTIAMPLVRQRRLVGNMPKDGFLNIANSDRNRGMGDRDTQTCIREATNQHRTEVWQ